VNPRRLYRSRDRQLAGVAGGMAEYLEVDPTIVRILWVLSIFLGGFGILLYIIMAFIVPLDPRGMPGPAASSCLTFPSVTMRGFSISASVTDLRWRPLSPRP